ncbi:glycogen debranching N-terminal domain-containing protein [Streptomyces scopuliridis]|uniref:Glycogen-debranching protein n=1 Tax=Streptomyces scopuliridis RB72 TaxID=1440053 RepID=A0A2T7SMX3_9ACTN|nr:glycogen debranching N-terminal domain-containing protein [Streptomyces scopuliridis]PVE04272.1 glycogen-debranching protein [Streptomyces scopuliridis RB72]
MALTALPSHTHGTSSGESSRAAPSRAAPSAAVRSGALPHGELPDVHRVLLCVALPCLAVSPEHGQLNGQGLEGFYQSGRRLLSRCLLRIAGRDPLPLQGRLVAADRARFSAVVRTSADAGPDPEISVERLRDADGTERITLHSSARGVRRFPVEITLGTDLAELAAIAVGRAGPELPASVHAAGLRWATADGGHAVVAADPAPQDALASAGLLRWDMELAPGASRTIELRIRTDRPARPTGRTASNPLPEAGAEGDDPRVRQLFAASLGDLRALLLRGPGGSTDVHPAAGVPWRCGPPAAEALWAVRMALPLGTRLAAGTMRTLARTQFRGPGRDFGRIPGPLRDAGPHLPPSCTGVEATLAFPVVLAEARRWGLPEGDLAELLPTAERCLHWLRTALGADGLLGEPGPTGPRRVETQAHAHRAALLGADLLEACGRPGADGWREWAGALRLRFRRTFWAGESTDGRPAAARCSDGRLLPHASASAAHLLDTGLLGGGKQAPGLLDASETERLVAMLTGADLDSGWGLRGLGCKEPGHNPFGHRAGAVRIHETAVAIGGLIAAGYEEEAGSLLRSVLDAAETFGHRLPEMYAGQRRTAATAPVPHPAACRPAAVAAAAGIQLLTALAGIRPDAPARTVALRPVRSAPLGAVQLTGLRVAEEPFSVRVSALGLGMVEEAAPGLQLGV